MTDTRRSVVRFLEDIGEVCARHQVVIWMDGTIRFRDHDTRYNRLSAARRTASCFTEDGTYIDSNK